MSGLIISFLISFIVTLLIIRFKHLHSHLSSDFDLTGPQKFHKISVPRIGGIGIAVGIMAAITFRLTINHGATTEMMLLICAIPTFIIGLTEDLTKKIGVKARLFSTAISAYLVTSLLNGSIIRLDITGVDYLLTFPAISTVFTVFAMTGLANAYNIIDGFNGLSSMVGIITLLALGYISFTVNDPLMMYLSFVMAASILGFFIWNYPRGLIFLGDGGAYLIGFWIGAISVLLISRHEIISPWFAVLINGYPILETVFTIYRRKIHQGKSPSQPDGIHFHSLIFRRILNAESAKSNLDFFSANAKTAPYLWVLTSIAIIPAIMWPFSSPILITSMLVYIVCYIWLYKRIVSFKTPKWMHPY